MSTEEFSIEKIILSYRDYYGTYHNHKETMAWSATALYLVSIISITSFVSKNSFELNISVLLILLILSIFMISILFISEQLKAKSIAADMVAAISVLIFKSRNTEYRFSNVDLNFENNSLFPNFLKDEMKKQRYNVRSGREIKDSLLLFVKLKWNKLSMEEKFECSIFTIIWLSTVISIIAVMISYLRLN